MTKCGRSDSLSNVSCNSLRVVQDKGWSMFHSFVENTAVPGGFAALAHVARTPLVRNDYCESFVFAETYALKGVDS